MSNTHEVIHKPTGDAIIGGTFKECQDYCESVEHGFYDYEIKEKGVSNNNELKCTPGEWIILAADFTKFRIGVIQDGKEINIASTYPGMPPEDAHLMTASKDLYEALMEVRKWYEKAGFDKLAPDTPVCFSKALSALQKANPNYKP